MLYFARWKIALIVGSCILFVLLAIPSFIPETTRNKLPDWLPKHAVNLGLDLQGGSQLLLEIDFDAFEREQLTNLVDEIRNKFREQKIGYRGLAVSDNKVNFSLRDDVATDVEQAIHSVNPDLDITKLDAQNYSIGFSDKWHKR